MTILASRYFHINNGGVTYSVEDNGNGPEMVVKAGHFSHPVACTRITVHRAALLEMAKMYEEAAAKECSADSVHGATEMPYDPSLPRRFVTMSCGPDMVIGWSEPDTGPRPGGAA
ncbi:hypothetical protein [Myxococcus landrumensis]|uniref:Lipoprotein n=1 Tax=Myxococcus landrumensis TaxID=2813577 RepID=A0ABX7N5P4_9BACT|nr:hypothetical protein [Myxococcus landrumus]QSQ14054.1 hypothetical protein JY572_38030 [Myxococcus landrumus]